MSTTFHKLNEGWNAEPNSPELKVEWCGADLRLTFLMNAFQFPEYDEGDIGELLFTDCARYRLGTLNDEGWHQGRSRFADTKHEWGEFYEITGEHKLDSIPDEWEARISEERTRSHYVFYFRDEDFECSAVGWSLKIR